MSAPRTIRLRETPGAFQPNARIIDAQFAVVRGRRGWLSHLRLALLAIMCAAIAGLLTPPLVMAAQNLVRAIAPA